jgi:hypothetical protein
MDPNDFDMSASGSEFFPEATQQQYNSYQDVQQDQLVHDPLDTGVQQAEAAAPQMSDKEMNFRALRDEVAKFKEERDYLRGQLEAYSRTQKPEPAEPYNPFKDVSDDDWVSASRVKDAFNQLRSEFSDKLAAVETKSQHSDWNNMVTQHIPDLTSRNPIFAEMIQKASNPYEAAYQLAALNARGATPQAPQQQYGQRAIQNAQKPTSLSSIGGVGKMSQADYYAQMSDEDFIKVAARNLANI